MSWRDEWREAAERRREAWRKAREDKRDHRQEVQKQRIDNRGRFFRELIPAMTKMIGFVVITGALAAAAYLTKSPKLLGIAVGIIALMILCFFIF